ncbi:MAG TPA: hypothetical protein VKG45_11685 [Actinomycetes bacterium]|nr:hypothetical protein [Actinomycetes bacterium]
MRTVRSMALLALTAAAVAALVLLGVDAASLRTSPGRWDVADGGGPQVGPVLPVGGITQATRQAPARPPPDGYAVEAATTRFRAGLPRRFSFRILEHGRPVTAFRRTHERLLHMIVVRHDLTEYQHLHPALGRDGTWSITLGLPRAGAYRVFVDTATGRGPFTLHLDLRASGHSPDVPLPPPSPATTVGPYTVALDAAAVGTAAELRFQVSVGGRPVTDLEPYMGARGHLVILRASDLAYLHVHPEGHAGGGHDHLAGDSGRGGDARAGGPVTFAARFPSAGAYRMFLQFRHRGQVRTAAFTFVLP